MEPLDMDRIGEQIRAELSRVGADSGAGDAVTAWPAAVGDEIARNAWPARTQPDGTLVVHVRDAIWGFELTQRATEISERLPGRPRLRFTPGPLPDTIPGPSTAPPAEASPEQAR
jgi:Dna[CI] antecedent, DciA